MQSNSREQLLEVLKSTTAHKRTPAVTEVILIPILGRWERSDGRKENFFSQGNVPLFNKNQSSFPQIDIDAAVISLVSSDDGSYDGQTFVFPAKIPREQRGSLDCYLMYDKNDGWLLCENDPHSKNDGQNQTVGIENVLPTLLDIQIELQKFKLSLYIGTLSQLPL